MGLRSWLFALTYNRLMSGGEKAGLAEIRAQLLAGARGDVLEVGAGTGLNLTHYTGEVDHLTVTEPDVPMLRRLERAARARVGSTTVLRAPAEDLPFEDATFDAVVCTLVLCGVEDQPRAVREIRRVLKPGGRLLLIEHVRSGEEAVARRQDRINAVQRLIAGCDCNRPTLQTLAAGGFTIDGLVHGELPKAPSFARPMIAGAAARPLEAHAAQSRSGTGG